jgi:hypothetical protein
MAKRKLIKKKKLVRSAKEEVFLHEDSKIVVEDAIILHSTRDDVRDELSSLDAFKDFERECRGNNLTFGDY